VKSPRNRAELSRRLTALPPVDSDPFPVEEIILYRSNLSPQGAVYLPLRRISLEG